MPESTNQDDAASGVPGHDAAAGSAGSRDLRDRWSFRLAAVTVVLTLALIVAKGCGGSDNNVSQAEAERIARATATFVPDRLQIRRLQQGIPPAPIWAVSLYDVDAAGNPTRFQVVKIDARTGDVIEP